MSDKTRISWCDTIHPDGTVTRGATWNPVTGCSHVSEGCRWCYAEALSLRFGRSKAPWTAANAAQNVQLHPDRLGIPMKWGGHKRIFVNSMSDLFHENVPVDFIAQVFEIMAHAANHTYLVLTKRPERMAELVGSGEAAKFAQQIGGCPWPLPNVWLGTSVERQREADERLPHLLRTPAAVRFLSCEPLLGPIELSDVTGRSDAVSQLGKRAMSGIHWVIAGGESGPHFRPMDLKWARSLRDQCQAAGVPFWFKQSAGRFPETGKELDGQLHHELPQTQTPQLAFA